MAPVKRWSFSVSCTVTELREQLSMLDHMSDGRFILGLGRGLGRVKFEGFGRYQEDSREYCTEAAQMLLAGLESGTCDRGLGPRPRDGTQAHRRLLAHADRTR